MMLKNIIAYRMASCSPFETGGDFRYGATNPRALIIELHAEQEDVRTRRLLLQERINMRQRQISDCSKEKPADMAKSVYGWLTGAAVALIFGLLFSVGTIMACGVFGRFGVSTLLLIVGVVLALRAWGEYRDIERDRKNHVNRMAEYNKECEQLNQELYKLNLREAELEESIKAAQRYM